jgi:hypothetical protein
MATWPTAVQLKQRLDITSDDWDAHMDRLMAAGVQWAKDSVGDWVDGVDLPSDAVAQAALERAVEMATNGEASPPSPKSVALLQGYRRRFAIA